MATIKYFPSTKLYFEICQPVGLTEPIEPRSFDGIKSEPIQETAYVHLPKESSVPYSSNEVVDVFFFSLNSGTLLLIST